MENSSANAVASAESSEDCTFCRVTGTVFLSGVAVYAFLCSKKARCKPIDRYFSLAFGTGALCMAFYRGFMYKSRK